MRQSCYQCRIETRQMDRIREKKETKDREIPNSTP